MRFLDTNVLLYSVSPAPRERRKREIALALLAERHNALSIQVLQEFYVQATRPTRLHALRHEDAVALIRAWLRFPLPLLHAALEIKVAAQLSYWDAAIVAAASALGCREVFSENMSHGQRIGGVMIVNPFR